MSQDLWTDDHALVGGWDGAPCVERRCMRPLHSNDPPVAVLQRKELKGEIWEEWALTYGRNGSSVNRTDREREQKGAGRDGDATAVTVDRSANRNLETKTKEHIKQENT